MRNAALAFLFTAVLAGCSGVVETSSGANAGAGGTAGSAGQGGTAGSGGAAGTGGAGQGGSAQGGNAGAGGAGCTNCDFFTCCNGECVNTNNDIHNCGMCGKGCTGLQPYCDYGTCGTPPCEPGQVCAGTQFCCAQNCCNPGELCCTVDGPQTMTFCSPPTEQGTCPTGCGGCICASPDTPVATPSGERALGTLEPGDLVYSIDRGAVVAVPVLQVTRVPAPNHVVVEVTLDDGRVLEISPKHPTADGRTFADVVAGDRLGVARVASVRLVGYRFDHTYDLLPASSTGQYFAAGALIGSTLSR